MKTQSSWKVLTYKSPQPLKKQDNLKPKKFVPCKMDELQVNSVKKKLIPSLVNKKKNNAEINYAQKGEIKSNQISMCFKKIDSSQKIIKKKMDNNNKLSINNDILKGQEHKDESGKGKIVNIINSLENQIHSFKNQIFQSLDLELERIQKLRQLVENEEKNNLNHSAAVQYLDHLNFQQYIKGVLTNIQKNQNVDSYNPQHLQHNTLHYATKLSKKGQKYKSMQQFTYQNSYGKIGYTK